MQKRGVFEIQGQQKSQIWKQNVKGKTDKLGFLKKQLQNSKNISNYIFDKDWYLDYVNNVPKFNKKKRSNQKMGRIHEEIFDRR